jgi:hypothetical protein
MGLIIALGALAAANVAFVPTGTAQTNSTGAVTSRATNSSMGTHPSASVTPGSTYWLVASDGGIFSGAGAGFHGSIGALTLKKAIVGMAATPDGQGYWLVASDGGVFTYGDATFQGSTGALALNKPIVGMAPTPDGQGYWLVGSDGGVFSFGDATFHGSTGSIHLNKPIVGIAATPDGQGYWLVASDGGVFNGGDAAFFGSTGAIHLNQPIVGMAATPDGQGYWLVASDGGVFSYGDATFHGSTGAIHLNRPIVGMTGTPDGQGYWLVASDGGVFSFGDATFHGSTGAIHLNSPIVGMAETTAAPVGNGCGSRVGSPATSKVMVIYEENHSRSEIIGSSSAPNINAYADECGQASNYQAVAHPSLPNYMSSTSGVSYASSPWTSDCNPGGSCLTGNDNIFNQVGGSWRGYAESMSGNCSNSGPAYASKHNPAEYYTDLSDCATNDVPLGTTTSGALHSDVVNGTLPTFSTVTPNLNNDMHDGSIQQGDSWLAGWIPQIISGPDYTSGQLAVIIVWDEGSSNNNVAMVAMSQYTTPGTVSGTPFTHYSLLKAAEDVAGVPELGNAASANSLRTAFGF